MTEPRRRRAPRATPVAEPDVEPALPVKRGLPSGFATLRDVLCFVFGVGIITHEVFIQSTAEAAAIGVGVALCGLPLVFGADDKAKK